MTDTKYVVSYNACVDGNASVDDDSNASVDDSTRGKSEARFASIQNASSKAAMINGIMLRSAGVSPGVPTVQQQRASYVIQAAASTAQADVKDYKDVRSLRISSGSVIEYAGKQNRGINFTKNAFKNFRDSGYTTIGFDVEEALDPDSLITAFKSFIKNGVGSDITTYQGRLAEGQNVSTTYNSIHSWNSDLDQAFVGCQTVTVGKNYLYREGTDFNLGFGTGGSTTIGSSDDASFATEALFKDNGSSDVPGGRGRMAPHFGRWPRICVTSGDASHTHSEDTKNWLDNTAWAWVPGNPGEWSKPDDEGLTVTYDADGLLTFKGNIVNAALTAATAGTAASAINQTPEQKAKAIAPLASYANIHVGDSVTYQFGNNFNFGNHAANMAVNIGPTAEFNFWTKDETKWKATGDDGYGAQDRQDYWKSQMGGINPVVVEKTVGDTYSVDWGPSRSFTQSSDGANYSQDGAGWDETRFNTLKGKSRVTGNSTEIKSAAVVLGFDFTGVKVDYDVAAARKMSSQAEFGFNVQFGLKTVKNAELSITGCEVKGTFPRVARQGLNLVYLLDWGAKGASTDFNVTKYSGELDMACVRLVSSVNVKRLRSKSGLQMTKTKTGLRVKAETGFTARVGASPAAEASGTEAKMSLASVKSSVTAAKNKAVASTLKGVNLTSKVISVFV